MENYLNNEMLSKIWYMFEGSEFYSAAPCCVLPFQIHKSSWQEFNHPKGQMPLNPLWRCAGFCDTYDPPVKKRSNHTCIYVHLGWFCFPYATSASQISLPEWIRCFYPQPSTLCKSNSTTHPLMALWDAWNEVVCICLLGWRAAFSETPSNTFQHHQLQGFLGGTIKHEYGSNRHEN